MEVRKIIIINQKIAVVVVMMIKRKFITRVRKHIMLMDLRYSQDNRQCILKFRPNNI